MDACSLWLFLLFGLAIIAVVGHVIWITVAAVFKALTGSQKVKSASGPVDPLQRSFLCVLCRRRFSRERRTCPICGLDPQQFESIEVRELEIAAGHLKTLHQTGKLPADAYEKVLDSIDQRRDELLQQLESVVGVTRSPDAKAHREVPIMESARLVEAGPTPSDVAEVVQRLRTVPSPALLSADERKQIFAVYRRYPLEAWADAPADALLSLARLVSMSGLESRSLHVYRMLLAAHPDSPEATPAAAEGAALARRVGQADEVAEFIGHSPLLAATPAPHKDPTPTPVPILEPVTSPVEREVRVVAPRRSIGEMLAGFMEQRNILWGELVGGLLIVGCSIALVISLRETLENIPYFPFFMIGAVSAALIGAGRYTLSHWKLESTSRGLLVIGVMLVPLSFMVLGGLASGREGGMRELLIEAGAIALFTWLVWGAARILVRDQIGAAAPWPDGLTTLGIAGASASQLLVPHIIESDLTRNWLGLVGYLPAGLLLITQGLLWLRIFRADALTVRQAGGLYLALGLSAYAVAVALGFVVYRAENVHQALEFLAAPLAVAGLPLLLGGMIASQKLNIAPPSSESGGLSLGVARVIATILSLGGTLVMLAALVAAWPNPVRLMAIGSLNAVILGLTAHRFRLVPAYIPAQICLAIAVLTGFHFFAGHLEVERNILGLTLWRAYLTPESGVILVILAGLLAAIAEWCMRVGRSGDGCALGLGSGTAALVSLFLVGFDGWQTPGRAATVFTAVAVGGWLANLRWSMAWVTYLAIAVALGAAIFVVRLIDADLTYAQTLAWSLLAAAIIAIALAALTELLTQRRAPALLAEFNQAFTVPFETAALALSVMAALTLYPALAWDWLISAAIIAVGLSAIWLALAWRQHQGLLFAAFQAGLAAAVLFGVVHILRDQPWFSPRLASLVNDIRAWQAYGVGLSALALIFVASRFPLRRSERAWKLVEPGWLPVDRLLLGSLVILALLVTTIGVSPGIAEELVPLERDEAPLTATALHLGGPMQWCWLGLLTAALILTLWQGQFASALPSLILLALSAAGAGAALFAEDLATASALRWGLAILFIAGSALIWRRDRLASLASSLAIPTETSIPLAPLVRGLFIAGAVAPVLALTMGVASVGFAHLSPAGPLPGSLFHNLGMVLNNIGPLALLCLGLAGHAVRERSAGYAFAGGQVALLAVAGGYALGIITAGGNFGTAEWVRLGQIATGVLAVWMLAWLAAGRWLTPESATEPTSLKWALPCDAALALQESLIWTAMLLWLLPAAVLLAFPVQADVFSTDLINAFKSEVGSPLGWIVAILAVAAGVARSLAFGHSASLLSRLGSGGLFLGILAACAVTRWDADGWLGHHVMLLSWLLLTTALLALGWWSHRPAADAVATPSRWAACFLKSQVVTWVCAVGGVIVLLTLMDAHRDPGRPWWPAALALGVSVQMGALAVWTGRGGFIYASGLLFNLVGHCLWENWRENMVTAGGSAATIDLVIQRAIIIHVLCLALSSLVWSAIQIAGPRLMGWLKIIDDQTPFRHFALWLAVIVLGLTAFATYLADIIQLGFPGNDPMFWFAVAAIMAAATVTLWDNFDQRWAGPLPQLYLLGLIAIAGGLHTPDIEPRWLLWTLTIQLGPFVLLAALACVFGFRNAEIGKELGMIRRLDEWPLAWFPTAQIIVGALVILLSFWVSVSFDDLLHRLCGFASVVCLPAAGVALAPYWQQLASSKFDQRSPEFARKVTLILGVISCVWLHFAFIGLDDAAPWLHRNVVLMAALTWMAALYGFAVPRLLAAENPWIAPARRMAGWLGMLACAVLALVLVHEFTLYDRELRTTPMTVPAVVLVSIAFVVLIAGALMFALSPTRDPLKLSDRARTAYVYAAEILIVLLLCHLRLNIPDFLAVGRGMWPFIVMGIAFAGVGLSEVARRFGLKVLADPLQRTALFLPLFPVLAFLIRPLNNLRLAANAAAAGTEPFTRFLERLPDDYRAHAAIWFLMGLLYLIMALTRRSSNLALVAAMIANFGVWVLMGQHEQLAFMTHPQLWLIPIGIIILVAEALNRQHLQPSQALALRYAGILLIYVSSTADLFIEGLGGNVLLPIALAVLSVAGVLLGILFRIRAYLFLGMAFLFLVVFSQIWHAAVNRHQTWVWWASGIVLGVAILTLFAIFEKRRNDVLKMLDELKRWQ